MRYIIVIVLILMPHAYANKNTDYIFSFDVQGLMEHVLHPSAKIIWSSAGFIITETGETNLAPNNEEDWHNVEDHAAILMEAANLLIMPGRGPQEDEWIQLSKDLVTTGQLAFNAAQAKDSAALFTAGGTIYQSCLACHKKYIIDE